MLRIGIAYSLKPDDADGEGPDDRYEEFDKPETIEALAEAIRGDGHDVSLLGDGREFLAKMLADPPDFVFNIAEGQGIGRDREARVPCVCEMLGVPYSGSDPLTLAASLDKDVAKRLVAGCGHTIVGVPGLVVVPPGTGPEIVRADYLRTNFDAYDRYPVLLKPAFEGSSKGIRGDCVADDEDQAVALFGKLAREYCQPILIEDFIEGDELTVGILGGGSRPHVLGVMRVIPREPVGRFVYSLEMKRDWRNQIRYESPAQLSGKTEARVVRAASAAYQALGCRDVARIDFRLDEDGHPYFIEANPLPGLAPVTSDLVILAQGYGIGHGDLVRMILRTALQRIGLGASLE